MGSMNKDIKKYIRDLARYDTGGFDPAWFAKKAANENRPPEVVADTLKILLDRYKIGAPPPDCWPFVESILYIKIENYYEKEGIRAIRKQRVRRETESRPFMGQKGTWK